MLILTTLPDRKGSLGYNLFTEPTGGHLDQKLLVVKLTDTKSTDLSVQVNDSPQRK
jgi:hypothetical protein